MQSNIREQDKIKDLKELIEPRLGESSEGYTNRIKKETYRIKEHFVTQAKQQLGEGYSTSTDESKPQPEAQQATQPEEKTLEVKQESNPNKVIPASKVLSKKLTIPTFGSKEEFQSWYGSQDPIVQQAVRLKLGGK